MDLDESCNITTIGFSKIFVVDLITGSKSNKAIKVIKINLRKERKYRIQLLRMFF